jgi:diguanylate cyclase (GGDEF)-like protein
MSHASDAMTPSSPVLLAVIPTLLSAPGIDDVRAATAHGARLVSRYGTLSLYESGAEATLELTHRSGDELGPRERVVERILCTHAGQRRRTVSTLDMFADSDERSTVAEYIRGDRLCLARPLCAGDDLVGVAVFHYDGRLALPELEFDTLRRFVEYAALALSIARTREELRNFAYTDVLTGLSNRRWLELEFARLHDTRVSLLLVDFDGLKLVNDTLGFDRGDALIHAVGVKIAASLKGNESVVRYGGDEFLVVMPNAGRQEALRRGEELTAILDDLALAEDLAPLFRGASVGPATAAPGEDLLDVLRRANTEMRSRKRRRKTDRPSYEYVAEN